MEKGTGRSFGLVIIVAVFLVGDAWLLKSAVANPANNLPKLNINALSASSFVIQNQLVEGSTLNQPLNILVLGRSGGHYIAPNLTDTIFIAHVYPAYKEVKIVSIPRDLAVKTSSGNSSIKINGLYQLGLAESETKGLSLIKNKVEEVTGLNIDKFLLFDLATVEQVIDEIGGVNISVKNSIYDPRFPTNAKGYETFALSSGIRFLNGLDALRFIRTRHSLNGDFDRIDHQQQIVKAIKGKLVSLNPVWDFSKLWSIFNLVQNNIRTDLTLTELKDLWQISKSIDLDKIETLSLNAQNGLVKPEQVSWQSQTADILVAKPNAFDYTDIKSAVSGFINK